MKKLSIGILMFVSGILGAAEVDPVAQVEQYKSDAALAQALQGVESADCLNDDTIAEVLREEEDDGDKGDGDDFAQAIELSQELFKGSFAETECTVTKSLFKRRTTGQETLAELFARRRGKAGFVQTDFERIVQVLLNIVNSAEETMKCLICHDELQQNLLHKIGITVCCNQCICSSCSKREVVQQRCPHCRADGKDYGIFRYDANQHKLFLTIYPRRSCCVVQ